MNKNTKKCRRHDSYVNPARKCGGAWLLLALGLSLTLHAQIPTEWKGRWWETYLEEAMLPLNLSMQNALNDWRDVNAESAINVADLLAEMTGTDSRTLLEEIYPVLFSPLQSSEAMQPTDYSFSGDTLVFEQAQIGLRLTLLYNPADSTFSGTFRQGIIRTTLTFRPCDTLSSFPRPQTPQEPYSFMAEQVVVQHNDRAGRPVSLAGTLAIPNGPVPKGGFPCAILITGSGQQDRDEQLFLHRPFLLWAECLAQQGIATLRCDDRGIGGSTGELASATTLDFADDVEAQFRFLRHRDKINPRRIGLMGHSEGGAIAPIVAARNKKVAFVVMLAGQGCTGSDVLLQQNEAIFRLRGTPDSLITLRQACLGELFLLENPDFDTIARILTRHTATLSPEQQKAIQLSRSGAYVWQQQLSNPWLRAFLRLNPQEYLPMVKCPILAINGEKDCQVLPQPNLAAIRRLAPTAETWQPEGLNHLLQHCQTGATQEYLYIEQTIAPEVLERVGDFIRAHTR